MFTHECYDDLGVVKRFTNVKEAKWFAEANNLQVKSTGYIAQPPVDLYAKSLAECGECLL